ncbi:TPA: hypothetical protein DCZ39_08845 [Patescibacteria group bacterium]|nr:hypothetical protein [Candidatus Gracilibacteria bacterium]
MAEKRNETKWNPARREKANLDGRKRSHGLESEWVECLLGKTGINFLIGLEVYSAKKNLLVQQHLKFRELSLKSRQKNLRHSKKMKKFAIIC